MSQARIAELFKSIDADLTALRALTGPWSLKDQIEDQVARGVPTPGIDMPETREDVPVQPMDLHTEIEALAAARDTLQEDIDLKRKVIADLDRNMGERKYPASHDSHFCAGVDDSGPCGQFIGRGFIFCDWHLSLLPDAAQTLVKQAEVLQKLCVDSFMYPHHTHVRMTELEGKNLNL